jgi:hypothetical protein
MDQPTATPTERTSVAATGIKSAKLTALTVQIIKAQVIVFLLSA